VQLEVELECSIPSFQPRMWLLDSPRLRSEGTGKHGSSCPGLQNSSKISSMGQTTVAVSYCLCHSLSR